MMKKVVIAAFLCGFAIAEFSLNRVSECVNQKLLNRKFKKAKEASFELNYGVIGLETFNAVSTYQMKQIEFLAQCVQEEDPGFFLLSSKEDKHIHHQYGGSNVTTLTGIFQQVLPDIHRELMQATTKMLRKADWVEKRKQFGVKSVAYISFEKEGMEEYRTMIQEKLKEVKKAQESFVIVPHDIRDQMNAERANVQEERIRNLLPFVNNHNSIYTLIILFDDRTQFAGGEIMIEHKPTEHEENDEEYEDEEHDIPSASSSSTQLQPHQQPSDSLKRSMFFNIETITLEKQSMLLINGKLRHGTEALQCGRRRALVIDLWQYKDAPITKHMISLQDGEALGLIEEQDVRKEL